MGLAVAVAAARPERRLLAAAMPLLCAPAVAWAGGASPWNRAQLTSGTNVYFGRTFVGPDAELRFWHEDAQGGVTTVVDVPTAAAPVRVLLTNGKFQGNDGDEIPAQTGFALVPLAVTPGRERVLVIGAGTGHTAHVLWSAGVHDVEVAEIAEGIVAA